MNKMIATNCTLLDFLLVLQPRNPLLACLPAYHNSLIDANMVYFEPKVGKVKISRISVCNCIYCPFNPSTSSYTYAIVWYPYSP